MCVVASDANHSALAGVLPFALLNSSILFRELDTALRAAVAAASVDAAGVNHRKPRRWWQLRR